MLNLQNEHLPLYPSIPPIYRYDGPDLTLDILVISNFSNSLFLYPNGSISKSLKFQWTFIKFIFLSKNSPLKECLCWIKPFVLDLVEIFNDMVSKPL